ncbi:MAG: recombinase family protein [Bacilli bacterium]
MIVKRIYSLFLEGKSQSHIADILTSDGVKAPGGKTKWFYSTIDSILSNEKYKGSALLQNNYSVDFLTKTFKKNEGEIPQYYVEESHPAIIDPYEWEQVQIERNIRNETKSKSHKSSILCSRIFCEECGSAYGLKVWHSNDKGRKLVCQCNNKYKNKEHFCSTPHIDDKRIKEMFIDVFNQVFKAKTSLINDFELVKDKLFTPTN